MSSWPEKMSVGPIREWPGTMRAPANREVARFKRPGHWENDGRGGKKWVSQTPMPLSVTLQDLDRELRHLGAADAELLVAIDPTQFRNDGRPYANAKSAHPGVILSFTIPKIGTVSYPCDKYTRWEDNLRAIAAALESLRLVERHGVTRHGEQYRGFLAIEATAAPAGFATKEEAVAFLADVVRDEWENGNVDTRDQNIRALVRGAQRRTHPDHGGDSATFQRVSFAEARLREAGLL